MSNEITFTTADKAKILIDALPYIRDFAEKIIVIEYDCRDWLTNMQEKVLLQDIVLLKSIGMKPIVVHHTPMGVDKFRENKRIAKVLEMCGRKAIGVCGIDKQTLKITLENDYIPVIVPNDIDTEDEKIDPKETAVSIAKILGADKIIFLSNYPGIFKDETRTATEKRITVEQARAFQSERNFPEELDQIITLCIDAVENGVHRAHILDGRVEHVLLLELFSIVGAGTVIIRDDEQLYRHERYVEGKVKKNNI